MLAAPRVRLLPATNPPYTLNLAAEKLTLIILLGLVPRAAVDEAVRLYGARARVVIVPESSEMAVCLVSAKQQISPKHRSASLKGPV